MPQALGIPKAMADLVRVVPFNDLTEAARAFEENEGKIAGMIVEPAMMNCGVILPDPGYLQGLKDLAHAHGAYLAFDEVKTGATIAFGGAVEAFGVTPDIVCLAKAIGGGLPCGAIGATRELYRPVLDDEYDMAGTFNGNPLTMAATKATLTEVLTRDAYDHLNAIHKVLADGCTSVIEKYRLPAYVDGPGREGLGHLQRDAGPRVPRRHGDRRADHVRRLALPAEPRRLQVALDQAGDVDDLGVPHRRGRRALRGQLRGARRRPHGVTRRDGLGVGYGVMNVIEVLAGRG